MYDSRLERFGFDRIITFTALLSTKDRWLVMASQCQMYFSRVCARVCMARGTGGVGDHLYPVLD